MELLSFSMSSTRIVAVIGTLYPSIARIEHGNKKITPIHGNLGRFAA